MLVCLSVVRVQKADISNEAIGVDVAEQPAARRQVQILARRPYRHVVPPVVPVQQWHRHWRGQHADGRCERRADQSCERGSGERGEDRGDKGRHGGKNRKRKGLERRGVERGGRWEIQAASAGQLKEGRRG